jgi:hypothetical protein
LPKINAVLKSAGQAEIVPRTDEILAAKNDVVTEDDDM